MNAISFYIFNSIPIKLIYPPPKQHAYWMILWQILQKNFYVFFIERLPSRIGNIVV